MLSNRDFSKSNKEYFNKNKFAIIILSAILLVGLLCGLVFGFNGNFELKGYNEFNISVGNLESKTVAKWEDSATDIVNKFGGDVFKTSIEEEGDNAKIVIQYNKTLKASTQDEVNKEIATKLGIAESEIPNYISAHHQVGATVKGRDYLFTAVAIILLVTIATIFAIFRYDSACAMSLVLSCGIGSLLFMSFSTILRLKVGLSYFAMLFIVNLLIIYCAMLIFEHIRETSWLQAKEYSTALSSALKDTRIRMLFISLATLAIGLVFAIVAPANIKFVSLNIMFMAVTLLAVVWYVLPFCWSVLITSANIRRFKTKTKKVNTKTENVGETKTEN